MTVTTLLFNMLAIFIVRPLKTKKPDARREREHLVLPANGSNNPGLGTVTPQQRR
ncbi:hypothetical protein DDI_2417 [Dickeya dianthicola RNS04.9]|nr:hypothetical protein DDI_2417 [Dickeya dianthicola RNS04.9]